MSLWIKICGNTSLEDAQLAAEAGADAVGFVFAPSPRRVTPAQVAAIVPHLPASLEKLGVFVDSSFNEIASTVETCALTGVQAHWDAPPELPAMLRARFGSSLRILSVVHFEPKAATNDASVLLDPNIDAILVDSRTDTAIGGTGQSYDWASARRALFGKFEQLKLVAAGGLTPENVAEAIAALCPWGVDVVSGVETAPGRKDPAKVRAFIAKARAASAART
ncbi:MAG: phosphoribosylanthranilate isomerase [Terracidiphilus sp.]|jgi:phosphoribosylanthranilate isomerase